MREECFWCDTKRKERNLILESSSQTTRESVMRGVCTFVNEISFKTHEKNTTSSSLAIHATS